MNIGFKKRKSLWGEGGEREGGRDLDGWGEGGGGDGREEGGERDWDEGLGIG